MIPKPAVFACLCALALASAGLTSCNKSVMTVSSGMRMDSTVNDKRTITTKVNDLTRKLETKTDVKMEKGKITSFPKAAIVKLEESGSSTPRVAELRENGGVLELWVSDGGTFRRGTAEEEAWAAAFLKDVIED